ncbi:molybdate ABC transporter substrate-binding protein [Claveliimonas bilis]|uniref:molybdate ABC transporter substrate-binding protein n=1 Tax=Claveliimonas bilis TaxID=3028070 RepID=UPI001E4CE55C|nr:molybdate ABC transporter substrate-binding protein [Claveliimonas bilis]BCZ27823.1 molybdate ABC transporter substrate-binding protein [Claveliimonas bilis]BDZ83423.1 molybdate ABC transporter substrate-binding protein [Claveliimonas bilis]
MKRKIVSLLLVSAMTAVLAAGCGSSEENADASDSSQSETEADTQEEGQEESGEDEKTEILVAASASLEYAYEDELIPMFEEQNPDITVSGTYDSSGKLQTQIEEGMEADVFMSAATKQMDALTEEGMIEEDSVTDLLENKIVLITSADSQLELSSFEDITKADTIAIGDPASVPVGQYSEEALTNLGLWDQVLAKASLGTNVTEVLNWVAEGSAQAGIVYATDAATTDKVKVVAEAPEDSLAEPAIYPVGIVSASENKEAAEKFVKFLKSDEAIQIFEDYGFIKR